MSARDEDEVRPSRSAKKAEPDLRIAVPLSEKDTVKDAKRRKQAVRLGVAAGAVALAGTAMHLGIGSVLGHVLPSGASSPSPSSSSPSSTSPPSSDPPSSNVGQVPVVDQDPEGAPPGSIWYREDLSVFRVQTDLFGILTLANLDPTGALWAQPDATSLSSLTLLSAGVSQTELLGLSAAGGLVLDPNNVAGVYTSHNTLDDKTGAAVFAGSVTASTYYGELDTAHLGAEPFLFGTFAAGQILYFNGTDWTNDALSSVSVTSLNGLTGAVTLVGGDGVSVVVASPDITLSAVVADATLTLTPSGLAVNLANPNTWTATQSFPVASIPNATLVGPLLSSLTATNGLSVSNPAGVGAASYSLVLNGTTLSLGASGLSINLANANTWTATQTFPAASLTNAELAGPVATGLTTTTAIGMTLTAAGTGVGVYSYTPSVTFGGDVSGTSFSAMTLAAIQAVPVVITTLASGNILQYNGTDWVNVALSSAGVTSLNGLTGTITIQAGNAGITLVTSSPDINISLAELDAGTLAGKPFSLGVPAASDVVQFNGTDWVLVTLTSTTANVSSVSNSDGTLTISPTTGVVVASLNLAHANTWTALQTFTAGIALSSTWTIKVDTGGNVGFFYSGTEFMNTNSVGDVGIPGSANIGNASIYYATATPQATFAGAAVTYYSGGHMVFWTGDTNSDYVFYGGGSGSPAVLTIDIDGLVTYPSIGSAIALGNAPYSTVGSAQTNSPPLHLYSTGYTTNTGTLGLLDWRIYANPWGGSVSAYSHTSLYWLAPTLSSNATSYVVIDTQPSTSTATLQSSVLLDLKAHYWTTSPAQDNGWDFTVQHVVDSVTPTSHVVFAVNGTPIFQITSAGIISTSTWQGVAIANAYLAGPLVDSIAVTANNGLTQAVVGPSGVGGVTITLGIAAGGVVNGSLAGPLVSSLTTETAAGITLTATNPAGVGAAYYTPSISVGGDVSGSSLAALTVVGLDTFPLTITTPATNQVLVYNGTKWVNATVPATSGVTSLNGLTGALSIAAGNAGITVAASSPDINISLAELDVGTLGGKSFSLVSIVSGDFVYFNGTDWVNQSLGAGTGISVSGFTVTNTGIISASAGSGISVSGTNPLTITNTGVLSLDGQTGALTLVAGNGIAVSTLTLSAVVNGTTLSLGASGLSLNLSNANTWEANVTLDATGTATSSATFPSYTLQWNSSYWTGSAAATHSATLVLSASDYLTLGGAHFLVSATGVATSVTTTYPSYDLAFDASYWNGTAAVTVTPYLYAETDTSGNTTLVVDFTNVHLPTVTSGVWNGTAVANAYLAGPLVDSIAITVNNGLTQLVSGPTGVGGVTITLGISAGGILNASLAGPLVTGLTTETAAGITLTASGSGVGAYAYIPSVTLGGDLSGSSLGAASLAKIQGVVVLITTLTAGNVLQYNGTDWVNSAIVSGVGSVSNSDGTLTVSPTTGAVVASLNRANANTWTATQTFPVASIPNATLAGPLATGLTTASGVGITLTASGSGVGAYAYTPSITGNLAVGAFGVTFTAIADASTAGKVYLSSTTANTLKFYDTQVTPVLHTLLMDAGSTAITTLGTIVTGTWQATPISNAYLAGPLVSSLTTETAAGITLTASGAGVGAYAYTPSVSLGGDLSGSSLASVTLAAIHGVPVVITSLLTNQVLQYNGTDWVNAAIPSAPVSSVSNSDGTLTISPTTGAVVASLDLAHANTWSALQTFGADISFLGAQVSGAIAANNLLFYNGTNWIGQSLVAGTGISVAGTTISTSAIPNSSFSGPLATGLTLTTNDGITQSLTNPVGVGTITLTLGLGTITAATWNGTAIANAYLAGPLVTGLTSENGLTASGTGVGAYSYSLVLNGTTLSLGVSGLSINLGNANTWLALQTMGAQGTATSLATYPSYAFEFQSSYWTGSAAATYTAQLQLDATDNLELYGANLLVTPVAAATSVTTTQPSWVLAFGANYWNGSASVNVTKNVYLSTDTSGNTTLNFGSTYMSFGTVTSGVWQGSTIANAYLAGPIVNGLTTESGGGITLTATNPAGVGAAYYVPSIALGGDVSGSSLTAVTLAAIKGVPVVITSLLSGQVLQYNGTDWVNATPPSAPVSSVSNSDGTLTISPTTGAVVASLALGHANTWTATQTFPSGSITNAELAGPLVTGLTTESGAGITLTTSGAGVAAYAYTPSITGNLVVGAFGIVFSAVADASTAGKLYLSSTTANVLKYYDTQATPVLHQLATLDAGSIPNSALGGPLVDAITVTVANGLTQAVTNPGGVGGATITLGIAAGGVANASLAGPLVTGLTTESGAGITLTAGGAGLGAYSYTPSITGNLQVGAFGVVFSAVADASVAGKLFLSSTTANDLKFYDTQATPILHVLIDSVNVGSYAVTSLSSANAGITVSASTGPVTLTLGELDLGTLGGKSFAMTTFASGQVLTYNGTDWVNAAIPSAPVSSVSNSDGTLTISPTTGAVVASLALGHANTWTAAQTFDSSDLLLYNPAATFAYTFAGAAITAARTITLPLLAANDTLAVLGLAQTFSAKQSFGASIALNGATSGTLTMAVPATVTSYSVTFPSAVAGGSNYVLVSDATGALSWVAPTTIGPVTSVSNSDGTLTISPTTGAVVASLALGHANTWTATQTFPAASLTNAELAGPLATGLTLTTNDGITQSLTNPAAVGTITLTLGLGTITAATWNGTAISNTYLAGPLVTGLTATNGLSVSGAGVGAYSYSLVLNGTTLALGGSGLSLNLGNANTWANTQTMGTTLLMAAQGTATVSVTYPSYVFQLQSSYWTGSAAATYTANIQLDAGDTLWLYGANFALGSTGTATSVNTVYPSYQFKFSASYWNGSAAVNVYPYLEGSADTSGNSYFIMSSTYLQVGTINSGTWNGTAIANAYLAGPLVDSIAVTANNGITQSVVGPTGVGGVTITLGLSGVPNAVLAGPLVTGLSTQSGGGITLTAGGAGVGTYDYVPSVSLGGDVSGSALSSVTVAGIRGVSVVITSLLTNQILQYNGTDWVNAALPSAPVSSVSNSDGTLTISPPTGAVVASLALGHANTWTGVQTFPAGSIANSELGGPLVTGLTTESGGGITLTAGGTGVGAYNYTPSVSIGGDVSGSSLASLTVTAIRGTTVTITTLVTGDFLYYNGVAWVNQALAAGTGISVSNFTITNSGVTSLVAGTGISVSAATGAVTVSASAVPNASLSGPLVSSITAGTNVSAVNPGGVGAATVNVVTNPTFSGLVTGQAGFLDNPAAGQALGLGATYGTAGASQLNSPSFDMYGTGYTNNTGTLGVLAWQIYSNPWGGSVTAYSHTSLYWLSPTLSSNVTSYVVLDTQPSTSGATLQSSVLFDLKGHYWTTFDNGLDFTIQHVVDSTTPTSHVELVIDGSIIVSFNSAGAITKGVWQGTSIANAYLAGPLVDSVTVVANNGITQSVSNPGGVGAATVTLGLSGVPNASLAGPLVTGLTTETAVGITLTASGAGVGAYAYTPSVSLGGDVSGSSLSSVTVAAIRGTTVTITSLTTNDLLQYNGTNWVNVLPTALGLVNSVSNSDGTLTVSPTTGAVVASLALGHANTWTALQTFSAGDFAFGGYGHDVITSGATGDLWYYNGTNIVNLAIGSPGYVLTVASGVPSWTAPGAATSLPWSALTNPTLPLSLTMGAADTTVFTLQQTTQTAFTWTTSTLTTGVLAALASTGTALSGSVNLMTIAASGANANAAVGVTGLDIIVTNTNATSGSNIALYLSASGATSQNNALLINAGDIRSTAAQVWDLPSNTSQSLRLTDGTNAYVTLDTRTGTDQTTNVAFSVGTGISYASAAGSSHSLVGLSSYTLTLTGGTNVTALNGMSLSITQPTVTDTTVLSVNTASTLYIAGAPIAGGSVTISNNYGILTLGSIAVSAGNTSQLVLTTTSGGDAGFMYWNFGVAPSASQTLVGLGGIQMAWGGFQIATMVFKGSTSALSGITDAQTWFYSYHLSYSVLTIDYYTGVVTTHNNTLDDGSGHATLVSLTTTGATSLATLTTTSTATFSGLVTGSAGFTGTDYVSTVHNGVNLQLDANTSNTSSIALITISSSNSYMFYYNTTSPQTLSIGMLAGNFALTMDANSHILHLTTHALAWKDSGNSNNSAMILQKGSAGTITAGYYLSIANTSNVSDARLKPDFQPYAADPIAELAAVRFGMHRFMREPGGTMSDYGVFRAAVDARTLPPSVTMDNDDGFSTVIQPAYSHWLVGVMQAQQVEIEKLRRRVKDLFARLGARSTSSRRGSVGLPERS